MLLLGNILIILFLIIVFILALSAIFKGYNGIKISKSFEETNKKAKVVYYLSSIIHMISGSIITLCYIIIILLILIN